MNEFLVSGKREADQQRALLKRAVELKFELHHAAIVCRGDPREDGRDVGGLRSAALAHAELR